MPPLLSTALTAAFAVAVFVAGQALQRFVLEPIQDQRKVIGQVAFALLMFANVANVDEVRAKGLELLQLSDPLDVTRKLRSLAAQLQESLHVIPAYRLWALLHVVRSQRRILTAIAGLVAWSNSVYSGQAGAVQDKVAAALGIIRNA